MNVGDFADIETNFMIKLAKMLQFIKSSQLFLCQLFQPPYYQENVRKMCRYSYNQIFPNQELDMASHDL